MHANGPPRAARMASQFKSLAGGAQFSTRQILPGRKARVTGHCRVVRCSGEEGMSLADLDSQGCPHPTKTALSKLKKAHISEALAARGLPSEGLKRELVNRLHSALQRAAVRGSLTGTAGGGGGRSPMVVAATALTEPPTREAATWLPTEYRTADPGVGHLQRRIAELDAELASFRARVAAVTAERDAERVKLEALAAGIEEMQTAAQDRMQMQELLKAAAALEANEAELDRLRATHAGFLERFEHLQTVLQSKDDVIEQLQRQLAEADAARGHPVSHAAPRPARAEPPVPVSHSAHTMEVPGVALVIGGVTLAVAAGTVYAASRRLLPPEQRHALDVATGLFAFAAAAYLLQA